MAKLENIQALFLTLTGACNLSCSYCFENDKNSSKMPWETVQKSLDWILSTTNPVELVFYGGEPLMEFPTIKRAVEYVNERKTANHQITFATVTNGVLMRREVLDFLAEHKFSIQLSFDGVPGAQSERGKGTWEILDRLLDELPEKYPKLSQDLSISITVSPATVKYLAESTAYFLEKRVASFGMSPVFTNSSSWQVTDIEILRSQYQKMYELSLEHYQRFRTIPYAGFEKSDGSSMHAPQGYKMCGVSRGEKPTIDTDGKVHACATFTDSIQTHPQGLITESLSKVELGSLHDTAFSDQFATLEERFDGIDLFEGKESKYSSYAKCGQCQYVSRCSVCPMSIGHIPGNTDPNRVPDFFCAFNLVLQSYQDLFQESISPARAFGWKSTENSEGLQALAAFSNRT